MIKFYGVFQLVKVVKEDKTKKGDSIVYFSAASNRGEDKTDFKFCKIVGSNADFMLRNLLKDDKGKYKSRKMMLEGYVETYTDNQEVECTANLKKEQIPQQAGFLKSDLKIKAKTTIQVPKDIYIVKHLEFVDKKKEMDVEVMINDDIVEYTSGEYEKEVAATKQEKNISQQKLNIKQESKGISNSINDAFEALGNLKMIDELN